MYGVNPMYDTVTRVQHREDIRRAAEFRAVREARTRTGAAGFLWKLYGRLAINNETGNERSVEYNPRSTC